MTSRPNDVRLFPPPGVRQGKSPAIRPEAVSGCTVPTTEVDNGWFLRIKVVTEQLQAIGAEIRHDDNLDAQGQTDRLTVADDEFKHAPLRRVCLHKATHDGPAAGDGD
jgi:hypothetical protein